MDVAAINTDSYRNFSGFTEIYVPGAAAGQIVFVVLEKFILM